MFHRYVTKNVSYKIRNICTRQYWCILVTVILLRWLAGASYLDLCFAKGVATSTFYHWDGVLWPIVATIDASFESGFPYDDTQMLKELAGGFHKHSSGILKGCVLVIDGFSISAQQPFKWEVKRPNDYCFCKGGFVVLAGCNVNARFIATYCNHIFCLRTTS
jgi:hypothetical protein